MKYKRILLKLSGEALMGNNQYGIDPERLNQYAKEIKSAGKNSVQIAIVIGGGNIYRGLQGAAKGMDRVQGDYMGMLATVINSLALQAELEKEGVPTKLLSALSIQPMTELMSSKKAISYLNEGNVVIISAGTGNPFFTTDTASVLRAVEIKADIILKGTRVDGVYTSDPEKNANATKFKTLTYDEAISKGLKIMDITAFTLCKENNLPICVFDMNKIGNLVHVINGEDIGSIISV